MPARMPAFRAGIPCTISGEAEVVTRESFFKVDQDRVVIPAGGRETAVGFGARELLPEQQQRNEAAAGPAFAETEGTYLRPRFQATTAHVDELIAEWRRSYRSGQQPGQEP